jgi:hypothetical protein
MVRYVLLRPLRPELDGQGPFQTYQTLAKQFDRASPLSVKGEGSWKSPFTLEPYTIIIMVYNMPQLFITGLHLRLHWTFEPI